MSDSKENALRCYYRAQPDYSDLIHQLFISYKAWFKKFSGKTTDRECITALKDSTHKAIRLFYTVNERRN